MPKKKILLTYDYELFLGKDSGDLYKSLINPTTKILDILKQHNASGLFFIDASMLVAIKDTACFDLVKTQIQDIIKQGNDIGLHIHPHWQDTKQISKCRWSFDNFTHFRLDSFDDIKLKKVIQECYELLSSIVYEVNKNYKINTFRAGGWSIQPFDRLANIFKNIGIKYDFSVLPNIYDDDKPRHFYDFKNCPDKYIWKFNDDICKENKNGNFIEISNTIFDMNIIDLMKNRKLIQNYKIAGDGVGAGKRKTFFEQLKRVRWNIKQILSSDAIDINIFKKYIKKTDRRYLIYVSHPKLFSDNSFEVLSYICNNMQAINYKDIKIDG